MKIKLKFTVKIMSKNNTYPPLECSVLLKHLFLYKMITITCPKYIQLNMSSVNGFQV